MYTSNAILSNKAKELTQEKDKGGGLEKWKSPWARFDGKRHLFPSHAHAGIFGAQRGAASLDRQDSPSKLKKNRIVPIFTVWSLSRNRQAQAIIPSTAFDLCPSTIGVEYWIQRETS